MGYGEGFYDLTYVDEYKDMAAEANKAQEQGPVACHICYEQEEI